MLCILLRQRAASYVYCNNAELHGNLDTSVAHRRSQGVHWMQLDPQGGEKIGVVIYRCKL